MDAMYRVALVWIALLTALPAIAEDAIVKVLTFNIWYGGEQVSFAQTVKALVLADADIIGIQEPDGNLRRLANAAGYSYVDEKRNIISRYPLFDPDSSDKHLLFTRVLIRPGA